MIARARAPPLRPAFPAFLAAVFPAAFLAAPIRPFLDLVPEPTFLTGPALPFFVCDGRDFFVAEMRRFAGAFLDRVPEPFAAFGLV
jgi:hypothetical protein